MAAASLEFEASESPVSSPARIKILDVFAERMLESVFSRLIEPPSTESLNAAKQRLRDLGALTEEEKLTPLGYHLACLPVDVRIGKLMLFGAIFRCLDAALTIAASLAFKSPFVREADQSVTASVAGGQGKYAET